MGFCLKRVGLFCRNVCLAKKNARAEKVHPKPEKDDIIFVQNLNHHHQHQQRRQHLALEGWNERNALRLKNMQKKLVQKNCGNHYSNFVLAILGHQGRIVTKPN